MNKRTLSERDICTKFIAPALENAGWNKQLQILEEVSFTDVKIISVENLLQEEPEKERTIFLYYNPIFQLSKRKTIIIL